LKYILFSMTNRCNRACPYCIAKDYVNNPGYPDAVERNDALAYFAKNAGESDLVELTGGEPTLLPWLEELVCLLDGKGAFIVLRTNGFRLFRNIYRNLVVAFNPHDETDEYRRERFALMRNTDLSIKPEIIGHGEKPRYTRMGETHPFTEMEYITADGMISAMCCSTGLKIGNVKDGIDRKRYGKISACGRCPFILGASHLRKRLSKKNCDMLRDEGG
jgi:hypothetical protein